MGLARFFFYIQQIELLLNKARISKDPAMWLFNNNARTPFFMLEALARVYAKIHNHKKFDKLKDHFKLIEDGIGQIDYYSSLSIAFKANKLIPDLYRQYIKYRLQQVASQLNLVLEEKEWLTDKNIRINKMTGKLDEADWLGPEKEVKAVKGIYMLSADNITKFATETDFHFDNVEEDVHELRRRLRWLSIYPQAFQGMIQYTEDIKTAPHLKKYLTLEIINSPYNKFPPAGNNKTLLLINKNYFFALSWIIAQLGNLKDEGLLLTGLSEAIKDGTDVSEEESLVKAENLLGSNQRKMQTILDDAEAITVTFLKEDNLRHLIS